MQYNIPEHVANSQRIAAHGQIQSRIWSYRRKVLPDVVVCWLAHDKTSLNKTSYELQCSSGQCGMHSYPVASYHGVGSISYDPRCSDTSRHRVWPTFNEEIVIVQLSSALVCIKIYFIKFYSILFCYIYIILYYIILYYIILYYIILYYIILYYIILYYIILYYIILYYIILYYIILYYNYIILYYIILYYIIFIFYSILFCYIILYYIILYYIILYYILFYSILLYSILLCSVILYCVILCYVMLCYVMFCYVMLCLSDIEIDFHGLSISFGRSLRHLAIRGQEDAHDLEAGERLRRKVRV